MKPVIIIYQEETKELKNATRVTKKKKKATHELQGLHQSNERRPSINHVVKKTMKRKYLNVRNEEKKRHEARMDGQVVLEALAK